MKMIITVEMNKGNFIALARAGKIKPEQLSDEALKIIFDWRERHLPYATMSKTSIKRVIAMNWIEQKDDLGEIVNNWHLFKKTSIGTYLYKRMPEVSI